MDVMDTRQKIIAGFFVLAIVVLVWQIYALLGNNSAPDHITKWSKNDYTVQHVAKQSAHLVKHSVKTKKPLVRRIGDIQKGVVK